MPIRGRVGRHTRLMGRHCQNWLEDQITVIVLLNNIDFSAGGAEGSLGMKVVNGVCSAELYSAVSRFEDKYFPGQRSGFVDPDGGMFMLMAKQPGPKVIIQSVRSVPKPPKTYLLDLHASLLDDSQMRGKWPAGEQLELDKLVDMAIKHVDGMMGTEGQELDFLVMLT
jgi:hypothetical protein